MGASPWQIIIVVIIIAILFGGKRLRNLGGDLGASLKGFKKAMKDDSKNIEQADDDSKLSSESKVKDDEKV